MNTFEHICALMSLDQLEYKMLKEPTEEVRKLLSQTVYGTIGGVRMRHCDTSWKLDELTNADFHVLYDKDELVGVVVYCGRRAKMVGEEMNTLYIRYFSVSPNYQNRGMAQHLTKLAVTYYRENLHEPTVVYAYIEAKNVRSQAVSDHFEPLSMGDFSPIYFSRFFPKLKEGVSNQKEHFEELYPSSDIINFGYHRSSEVNARYFTLRKGDNYASVRCYPVKWEVIHYPNNNWLMMKLLPALPVISKLVEGRELNFVAVDAVSWNSDGLLLEVFEHVLATYGLAKLMTFADNRDERFRVLRDHPDLGMMSKLQKPPKVGIQLFFHDVDSEVQKRIQSCPVEIRGFDVT